MEKNKTPSQPFQRNFLAIGKIGRCIGIKGQVKIFPMTPDVQRFEALEKIFVGDVESEIEEYDISSFEFRPNGLVISFTAISDRTQAERLVGKFLFIEEGKKISLAAREWFIDDIVGCEVILLSGEKVGTVKDIMKLPAQDIWIVNDKYEKEILIPASKGIIQEVNIQTKTIFINPPNGLLDREYQNK